MIDGVTSREKRPVSLRRTLGFWDLLLYGIMLISPTALMPVFGVVYQIARGHVITAVLAAMVAMLFTSVSYGTMARAYPQGGSAFIYVSREIHPWPGYLAGWCLLMDYVLNPMICIIWASKAAQNFAPALPYFVFVIFFTMLFTIVNLTAIDTTTRINAATTGALSIVVVAVVFVACRYLMHLPPQPISFFIRPFYDPDTFSGYALLRGTSIAVLPYIGFDGVSTLTDEAKNPGKTIPRAIVTTCLGAGAIFALEAYVGQLVWPRGQAFPDADTAYVYIAGRIGGPILFAIVNIALLLGMVGAGIAAQLGAARLLLAMGQDNALPRRFFGVIHPKRQIPRNNVLLIGAIGMVGALSFSFQLGTELLNFGALIAFMGVNLAALVRNWRSRTGMRLFPMLIAIVGFLTCLFIWANLSVLAQIAGTLWALVGLSVWFLRQRKIPLFDSSDLSS